MDEITAQDQAAKCKAALEILGLPLRLNDRVEAAIIEAQAEAMEDES